MLKLFTLIFLLFIISLGFSQVSNPVIIGTVEFNNKPIFGVSVKLVKNHNEVDNTNTTENGKFTFTLNANENYNIEFQKPGFVFQKIVVSTKIQIKNIKEYFPFSFSIPIYKMLKGLDTSFFRKPVLKIKYDTKQKNFVIDEAYQNNIKKDLDKFLLKSVQLCNKSYSEEIANGDQFIRNKAYEDAWLSYFIANTYKPVEQLPKTKIDDIKKIIFSKTTKELGYKKAVENGDKLFNNTNSEAHRYYQIALLYKPDAKYPSDQIKEIDEALNQFGFMKQQSQNNKLNQAENLFKEKKYAEALSLYQEAQNLNPNNTTIKNKIEEIKHLIANSSESENTGIETNAALQINNLKKEIAAKEKSGDKKSISELLLVLGNKYFAQGSYNKSIDNLTKSLKLSEETGDKKAIAKTQQNLGDIYATTYNYEKAIEYYELILQTKENSGNTDENEKIINKIGTMLFQQKQYDKAIKYFEKSMLIDEKKGDKKNYASALNNIGVAYYETGNFEKAVEHYEKALQVLEEIGSKKEISMSLNNLGNVSFDWKKFSNALEYYQKSLKYKKEIHYEKGIVISLYNIGKVYFETADYVNAVTFYLNSRELAQKISLTPFVFLNNKALAAVYYKTNEFKKAYELLNETKSTNETIFENDLAKQLSEIHNKYNEDQIQSETKIDSLEKKVTEQNLWVQFLNEKTQRDDELYKKQKQIQRLKLKTEKIISYSLLTGFILLGIIALFFYNRYKMKQKANAKLESLNDEILREKDKSDKLILNVLPVKVANDLKENGRSEPELYKNVTVMFADIVGFTGIALKNNPREIINELNEFFSCIDTIIYKNECERIKTIGDAYLAVCGMPVADEKHSEKMARAALAILKFAKERNSIARIPWEIRIGLHTGELVGGVVGIKKYVFDIFGDTVNTAARMETCCTAMKINVTEEIHDTLQDKFHFTDRGLIQAKGKGEMNMYFLEGENI